MKDLQTLRAEIDAIDTQLVKLFEARMACARGVADYKMANHLPILDTSREKQVIASRVARLEDASLAGATQKLFEELMALSRAEQQKRIAQTPGEKSGIAYCGVPGAYGDEACVGFFGEDCRRISKGSFEDVFRAVTSGEARYGVLPIENSSAGSVNDNYDLLGRYGCHIVGEYILPVRHCLLGVPGAKEEEIAVVYSHEQALTQCAQFLDEHASWRRIPYYNTAASAKMVAEAGDRTQAALASRLAAKYYGLEILREGVNTRTDNFTRFIIVSAQPEPVEAPDKATITFTLRHERGTLHRALACFVALGMNMMRIESRPNEVSWEYRFYVDLSGNVSPKYMDVLLESLRADCIDCRLLGVYCANGGQTHA